VQVRYCEGEIKEGRQQARAPMAAAPVGFSSNGVGDGFGPGREFRVDRSSVRLVGALTTGKVVVSAGPRVCPRDSRVMYHVLLGCYTNAQFSCHIPPQNISEIVKTQSPSAHPLSWEPLMAADKSTLKD